MFSSCSQNQMSGLGSAFKLQSGESSLERRRASKRLPGDASLYRCVICIDSPLELSAVRHAEHAVVVVVVPPPPPPQGVTGARHNSIDPIFFLGGGDGGQMLRVFLSPAAAVWQEFLHGGRIDLWRGFGYLDN